MTHLSELIEEKQRERGISGRELARRSGISEAEIRRIKKGMSAPKLETLEKMAGPLGLTLEELLLTRREYLGSSVAASASLVSWKLPSAGQHARTLDHIQQSVYDRVLKAGQDRDTGLVPMEADEALAEAAHTKGDWASEELLWLLAERSAAKREDWPKWANAMLRAGQTELNLSKFDVAKSRFITVLTQPEIRTDAKLEAQVRLAWVYFEEKKYHEANVLLSRVERKVKELSRDREGDPYFDAIREMVFQ